MSKTFRLTREEKSWVLYDVGNSAFVLVMVTAIMPIYFKDVAAHGIPDVVSTANWAFANSAASLILAVLAPVLGAIADYRGRKKPFFLFFLSTGLLFCVSLAFTGQGQWLTCLILFICAKVGWAGGNIFYDSFLVDVSPRERMDAVSARGYGFGYIGSVIPFLAVIALILSGGIGEAGLPAHETRLGFIVVAAWWLLFSLPAVLHLKQRHYLETGAAVIAGSFARLWETFTHIRRHRQVFLFLIAYFFYIDGVSTIITMATAYGRDLGFGVTLLILVLLVIQIVAFPCTLLYGRLAERFGTKTMLMAGIAVYCLATLLAFLLAFIDDGPFRHAMFWTIAILVASSMGGIQALSRSYFSKLIPPQHSAEFFGFYNVFGKFAAISGPFLMGVVGRLSGSTSWGVLSIMLLFIVGAVLLRRVEPS